MFLTGGEWEEIAKSHFEINWPLATFKITQILSPEKASERKGMSTVE